ncbi:MAG: TatD DNase family protein [Nonlabens sp.]|jgi:TatD DNase family protein
MQSSKIASAMEQSIFLDHKFLDFHTHSMRHSESVDVMEIVSIHPGKDREYQYFTVGLHPWWTVNTVSTDQKAMFASLLPLPNCLAMGEMGLDQLKGPTLDVQMDVLRSQLVIAQGLNKPVIIHCVRAFDQLIKIKREFPDIKKWCVHGYGRHSILAKQLIDQGFYLSLMPSKPDKYVDWFASLPLDKLFLETDSMPDTTILDVYNDVSALTGISVDELKRQMNSNAREFFGR